MAADRAQPRVVSGMRPTGRLHLGHLAGALGKWADLQADYDCMYFVADWHALTSEFADTSGLTGYAYDNVADWIAAGVDSGEEHAVRAVARAGTRRAVSAVADGGADPVAGTGADLQGTDRPIVGARPVVHRLPRLSVAAGADVIIYDARYVPVGDDQVPHLELAREVVRRFHQFFGEVFVEPQPLLTHFPRLPGLDNRKMSKSYANAIDMADDAKTVRKKVMRMFTDPKRVRADIPGTVEGNPVFIYHDAFNSDTAQVDDFKARYRAGTVGDVRSRWRWPTRSTRAWTRCASGAPRSWPGPAGFARSCTTARRAPAGRPAPRWSACARRLG